MNESVQYEMLVAARSAVEAALKDLHDACEPLGMDFIDELTDNICNSVNLDVTIERG